MINNIKLSNGLTLPNLCFGTGIVHTYRYRDCSKKSERKYFLNNFFHNRKKYNIDKNFSDVINYALECGCYMFDTSRAYGGSEYALGKALSKINRESYIVVSKVSNADQYKGNIEAGLEESLKELSMDYLDVYLLHWPVEGVWLNSWKQMEKLYAKGVCKAIGVCNCNIHHLEELKKSAEVMPMINQFECHPLFTQNELRQYCNDNDIQVMAYTSTARMDERLRKTVLIPLSKKYGKTMAQIILRWHIQIGNIPVFNSFDKVHIGQNLNVFDFELSQSEIDSITKININSRLRYDPDNCNFRQL